MDRARRPPPPLGRPCAARLRRGPAPTAHSQRLLPRPVRTRRAVRGPAAAGPRLPRGHLPAVPPVHRDQGRPPPGRQPRPGGELARHAGDRRGRPGTCGPDRPDAQELGPTEPRRRGVRARRRHRERGGRSTGHRRARLPAAQPLPPTRPPRRRSTGRAQRLLRRPVLPLHPLHPLFRRYGRGHRPDGRAARGTARTASPGAVFAEITAGAATTNLNLHGRLTDYEIVCPGEHSTAPEEARLHLEDLHAVHDTDTDRLVLRSRRLDREVVPLYLGYLVPMVLPEIPRTLLLFSPTARSVPDVWRGVPAGPETAGVTRRPRVRHHSLVLQRRSWTAADGSLPARAPDATVGEWYLAWHRWRVRHGLPAQVFATVHEETSGGSGGWFGGSKPQYVDFESPLSLTALEGLLAGKQARTVFEEMLPGESELHVTSPRGRHVAELAVEMLPAPASLPEEDRTP
ncbi:lantibiotic dehydratase [Streptomyces kaempferi]